MRVAGWANRRNIAESPNLAYGGLHVWELVFVPQCDHVLRHGAEAGTNLCRLKSKYDPLDTYLDYITLSWMSECLISTAIEYRRDFEVVSDPAINRSTQILK